MFKTTALNSTANRFIDEVGVTPGTRLEADDHNIWMDELVNAVEGAGLTLDATGVNRDQLLEALLILGKTTKNFIINGIGEINQRVTAFTLVKDEYSFDNPLHGPDRHEGMATGTAVTAGTFGVTVAASVGITGKAFKFAGVTLTGTGILYHRYRMEAKDAVKFKNQTVSFSSKVYHDVGSAIDFTVFVRKADVADNFGAVTAISDSGAQSIATATESDLNYESIAMGDCSNGIEIEIKIEAGAITTKNVELTELQFELNSIATDFEYRNIGYELALCQRYYCKTYDFSTVPGTVIDNGLIAIASTGHGNVARTVYTAWNYPVKMRSVPTILVYSPGTGASGKVRMNTGDENVLNPAVGDQATQIGGGESAQTTEISLDFHATAEIEL